VRRSDRATLVGAGAALLAGVVLVAGCSAVVDGRPVASPGAGAAEPSFPTPPPSISRPAPTPKPPPKPPPTSGAIPLPPNTNGYVFIETKSGKTRCQITTDNVGCEAEFLNSPLKDGARANGVNVSASGEIQWVLGNLGAIPTTTIDYRTYEAQGWTIAASIEGTRFTNNRTRHGMFVSLENVETF
jgi:hypothetical protein